MKDIIVFCRNLHIGKEEILLDMVLKVCVSDGSEIIIDGFDEISFHNEYPETAIVHSGYTWNQDYYNELLNSLTLYKLISIKRHDSNHRMEYRDHAFAFRNANFEGNQPLLLQTCCITTIINMYK
jgi:hypothetical protein